jgi:hypothetical protein
MKIINKKLIRLGKDQVRFGKIQLSSRAVVIPSWWLQNMGIERENGSVSLEVKGKRIIIRPIYTTIDNTILEDI